MPKTPPLIFPTPNSNLNWNHRPKVIKKKTTTTTASSIFNAQNSRHISFDDTDTRYIFDEPSQLSAESHNNDSADLTLIPNHFTTSHLDDPARLNHPKVDQQRVPLTEERSAQPVDEQEHAKSVVNKEGETETDNKENEQSKATFQLNEPFDSELIGLSTDFQKYMEEHREIKRSIEDKRRELLLYTEERMQYLDQRRCHFQRQLKLLRQYF